MKFEHWYLDEFREDYTYGPDGHAISLWAVCNDESWENSRRNTFQNQK